MTWLPKIAVLGLAGLSVAASAQNVAHGKQVFAQCSACHSIDGDGGKMGPDLKTVIGRKAGTMPGYAYSAAMKGAGLTWDDKTLSAYLAAPRTVVPTTKMPFAGLPKPADRADVIAYLTSLK